MRPCSRGCARSTPPRARPTGRRASMPSCARPESTPAASGSHASCVRAVSSVPATAAASSRRGATGRRGRRRISSSATSRPRRRTGCGWRTSRTFPRRRASSTSRSCWTRGAEDRRLGDGQPSAHRAGRGCARDGRRAAAAAPEAGVRPSMGSVGDAYDNAMCESFFATLEAELLSRYRFQNQAEAEMACFGYIEGWYNPHRRHSGLGYLSPVAFERRLTAQPWRRRARRHRSDADGDRPSPLPPSRTRLRRAASRSSILDRVSGSERLGIGSMAHHVPGQNPSPQTVHENGAASGNGSASPHRPVFMRSGVTAYAPAPEWHL